jgi:hypothetical protein
MAVAVAVPVAVAVAVPVAELGTSAAIRVPVGRGIQRIVTNLNFYQTPFSYYLNLNVFFFDFFYCSVFCYFYD